LLSLQDISPYRVKDSLTAILTSEAGRGATGVVLRGMLDADGSDGSTPLDVVVKLAFDSEQRAALRDEYATYRFLRSQGVMKGIATALGFFNDYEHGPSALVMRDAGVSLGMEPGWALTLFERWVFLIQNPRVRGESSCSSENIAKQLLLRYTPFTTPAFFMGTSVLKTSL